jgi:hypothetical protein
MRQGTREQGPEKETNKLGERRPSQQHNKELGGKRSKKPGFRKKETMKSKEIKKGKQETENRTWQRYRIEGSRVICR